MATLIAVYTSDGCVGRCDAKCYNAADQSCDCVCGGMNHGAGRDAAMQQTKDHFGRWLETYTEQRGLDKWQATVFGDDHRQTSLL